MFMPQARVTMLGLGQTCEEELHLAETFERLSKKTDKKPETRKNAATVAAIHRSKYEQCSAQQQISQVQAQVKQAEAAAGGGLDLTKIALYGGLFVAGALGLYLVLRKRK